MNTPKQITTGPLLRGGQNRKSISFSLPTRAIPARVRSCFIAVLGAGLACLGVACQHASGNSNTGAWQVTSVGTDSTKLKISKNGMAVEGMNQSNAFKAVTTLIQKAWNAYLMEQGFEFVSGKYYGQQGKELDASTSVNLEKLRNAKSEADAANALKTLQETNRAAEAAEALKTVPVAA